MFKDIRVRVIVTLIIMLAALIYLVPTLLPELPSSMKPYFPKEMIRLGLDLRGGMHLVLEVETEKAVENIVERLSNNLKDTLMDKNVRFKNIERVRGAEISLELPGKETGDELGKVLQDHFPDLEMKNSEIVDGKEKTYLKVKDKRIEEIKKFAVEQSLETIRSRIDQFGVSEPEILPQGDDRILIQLPGIQDHQRAIKLIGKTALLEFKLVDDEHSLGDALNGNIPPGDVVVYGYKEEKGSGQRIKIPYLVRDKALMTGDLLEKAEVKISDRFSEPYISIQFSAQGAKDFDRITGENVKRKLAIVLDGVVYSAPVIQERISGGSAQITGAFTVEEARDLAIILRAGALPAPVKILEQVTVGPSLGQDSIEKGILATVIGFMLVVAFMISYYRLSGMVAAIALFFNLILTLATLVIFKATLTLPGIAGIVLSVGMAVDSNVLIFERAREEIDSGKTPRSVIETGYSKAFMTILDTHITTLIAALFLFQFGTGPVKGFAVTLTIGLIYSLFTAVFVTRIVFDYFVWNKKIKKISIGNGMKLIKPGLNINFVGKMKMFVILSISLIVLSIIYLVFRGGPNLGIDFAGGTSVQVKFHQATTVERIRGSLKTIQLEDSTIQQVGAKIEHEYLLRTETSSSDPKGLHDKIEEAMTATYGKDGFEIRKIEDVGPKVGKDLRQKGFLALGLALLGMLLYITFRYELRYALGGIFALFHDVIITVGVFTLVGREFTLEVIAALLTIIGFSINDTIVIFDRIRENIRKDPKQDLAEIVNVSVNQTMSRTILTNITVFLTVLALFLFGGPVINDFSFVLLIGVIVGTYSTVYIASPLVLIWESFSPLKNVLSRKD